MKTIHSANNYYLATVSVRFILSLLAPFLVSGLLFSCKPDEEKVKPKPATDEAALQFDESNTPNMSWEELPAELRNAIPMDNTKSSPSGREAAAVYSHLFGPFGGTGGSPFYIFPPNYSRLYAMAIRSGSLIDRIQFWYIRRDGTIYTSGAGGTGGRYYLQYFASGEYIYQVYGRSGRYVNRLSFYTRRLGSTATTYRTLTFGGTGGSPFYATVPAGYQLFGFWGRAGAYVDQIGFYGYTL
jgi:hypothetical protein